MKVGDYVRTKEFGISKVKWFDNNEPILENGFTALQKEYKSSPNIIDLIEVGDYVNGVLIDSIDEDNIGKYVLGYGATLIGELWFYNNEIKSIVTKEQFENMEYKIGE